MTDEEHPPQPWLTWLLIVLNVAVFLVAWLVEPARSFLRTYAALSPAGLENGRLWILLTATILHADGVHLVINMVMLFWLGRIVEEEYGRRDLLLLYTVGGLATSLTFCILLPLIGGLQLQAGAFTWADPAAFGASGSLFGLIFYVLSKKPSRMLTWAMGGIPLSGVVLVYGMVDLMGGRMAGDIEPIHTYHVAGGAIGYLLYRYRSRK